MRTPPELPDEKARLDRLARLKVLDTGAEEVMDAFTELAAEFTGLPVALISLVDENRQWWKAAVGLPQGAFTGRDISFCGHAIASDELFEVEDATRDERFADNPIVTGEPHVIHYAGMPLVMPGGERIGTICVIDHKPGRLAPRERAVLARLARLVVRVLLMRERDIELEALERAQAVLRESEQRFRTMADTMPQIVWSNDAQGRPDYYNRRWYAYTGEPEGSLRHEDWDGLIHPDDWARIMAAWSHSLATGTTYEAEFRMRHHSGGYRWVLARSVPLRDEAGRVQRWLGTCTDIDDQKQVQAALQQADRRKDEFLAMLAHELRNPLAPIGSACQLLLLNPADPGAVQSKARLIQRQLGHMTALVDDLMDVSRVTRGMIQLDRDLVELRRVVDDALEQAASLIVQRGHQVQVQVDGTQPLRVVGDRVRLTQVVVNLLTNAAKYTPPGGHIEVRLQAQDGQARVSVRDDGSGISPELLPHVFELFTQDRRTLDRSQGGLGLGLALVRSLVEWHGGQVTARSDGPGRGSEFTVSLPLAPAEAAPAGGRPAGERRQRERVAPRRSLRIMVVDDHEDAGRALAEWLETQGHKVVVETDPGQALADAPRELPDVYVLDIGLPGMDGYELARRLRAHACASRARLVALTGYGQPEDARRAHDAGFDHHIVKPVDLGRLQAVLAEA